MLNSVDLFSGIGGFSFALRDMFKPLCYCDNNLDVVHILEKLMLKGVLPFAPIVDDVSSVDKIVSTVRGRRVHLVTAGFPCVGFSKRGRREGFKNEHSAMFFKTIDVIKALSPSMVMFENVAEILTFDKGTSVQAICANMMRLGYFITWTTCSASDVGKPHLRNRWFCLCCKDTPSRLKDIQGLFLDDAATSIPELTSGDEGVKTSKRLFALGNAIVPLAARLSFFRMYTAFNVRYPVDMVSLKDVRYAREGRNFRECVPWSAILPKHAEVCVQGTKDLHVNIKKVRTLANITLDPNHFKTQKEYVENASRPRRSPLVKGKLHLHLWPTPRTGGITHSHNLSQRTVRDLSTAAMYACTVGDRSYPPTTDSDRMNVQYVEWMMGYPNDYTKV